MFGFFRRPTSQPLSDAIRSALEQEGPGSPIGNLSSLRMVESSGRYSARKVTYFRVFDPATTTQRSLDARQYKDFDAFPSLVLRSGHVEHDGTVVLSRVTVVRTAETPVRTRAGRIVATPAADVPGNGNGNAGSSAVAPPIETVGPRTIEAPSETPAAGETR